MPGVFNDPGVAFPTAEMEQEVACDLRSDFEKQDSVCVCVSSLKNLPREETQGRQTLIAKLGRGPATFCLGVGGGSPRGNAEGC